MSMSTEQQKETVSFNSGFDTVSADQWKEQLQKDLKGVSFEDLIQQDRNGIDIAPFYTQRPEQYQHVLPEISDWYIIHRLGNKNINQEALKVLNNGATALHIFADKHTDWKDVLNEVDLKYIFLKITFEGNVSQAFENWAQYYTAQYPKDEALLVQYTSQAPYSMLGGKLSVHASIYNNTGVGAALENALVLSQLNEALHQLQAENRLNEVKEIHIDIAVDTYYFEQISKIRSLKHLTNFVLSKYALEVPVFVHAETATYYLTSADAPSNILRNSIAAMAAVIGGCDSLYIAPYAYETDRLEFATRISRNQQLVMKEESYFHQIQDKAHGSYFIENYTQAVSEKACQIFTEIESQGGWQVNMDSGNIVERINQASQAFVESYKSGKNLLIGINKYPAPEAYSKPLDPNVIHKESFGIKSIHLETELKK